MNKKEIPRTHAYYDGERYHCYNIGCQNPKSRLHEYSRHWVNEIRYIPYLVCSRCKRVYFGLPVEDRTAIEEYNARQEKAEEKRTQQAIADNNEAVAEIISQQKGEEAQLAEEIEDKEIIDDGGIIIPDFNTI